MRSIVVFDLPVGTKYQRKVATNFRKALLDDGFEMLQFSVYTRLCNNRDNANMHIARIKKIAPKSGSIRIINVTENQYSNMQIIAGEKTYQEKKNTMAQLSFF